MNLTAAGLIERGDKRLRPFVLTRSFYAGTQRYGAMWTGDNLGTWEHMAVGIKMCLANNIAGVVFAGCTSPSPLSPLRGAVLMMVYSGRGRVLRESRTRDARTVVPSRSFHALLPRARAH